MGIVRGFLEFNSKEMISNDEKVFQDLNGLLSWWSQYIYPKSPGAELEPSEKDPAKIRKCYKGKLVSFFKFLGILLNEYEIDALIDTIKPESKVYTKRTTIEFEEIYGIFIKDQQKMEKEKKEMKEAFKSMVTNTEDEFITMENFEKNFAKYDKKYVGAKEVVMNEIKYSDFIRDDKFYFNEFLDKMYATP